MITFVNGLIVDGCLLDGDADEGYRGVDAKYFVPNSIELWALIGEDGEVDRAGGRARFGCFCTDGGKECWGSEDVGDCPEADYVGVVVASGMRKESVAVLDDASSTRYQRKKK